MQQQHLLLALVALVLCSCVPREQYQALETERNFYRNQVALADSLADQQAITAYDEVAPDDEDLSQRIRQIEALTATNRALNNSYQDLQARYEELLGQSRTLLDDSGQRVTGLQQSLADRTSELERREDELRQLEADLAGREAAIRRIESDYAPAGGGSPTSYGGAPSAPQAYGTTARSPISASQSVALKVNELQNEFSQLLSAYPVSSYQLVSPQPDQLLVVLNEDLLNVDGFTISPAGQQLLRAVAGVVRTRPEADVLIVGHADNSGGNPQRAYEDSTDKAINVATQLVNFGMNPRKLTVAGKGMYDPVSMGVTDRDAAANRRTELVVTVKEY